MNRADGASGVATARAVAVAAGVVVLLPAAAVAALGARPAGPGSAAAPLAGLLGIVAPVIGYRLYLYLAESSRRPLEARFVAATASALGVTAGAALVGVAAFFLSARVPALIGLLTHVTLLGAIWPTPWRLEAFDRDAS